MNRRQKTRYLLVVTLFLVSVFMMVCSSVLVAPLATFITYSSAGFGISIIVVGIAVFVLDHLRPGQPVDNIDNTLEAEIQTSVNQAKRKSKHALARLSTSAQVYQQAPSKESLAEARKAALQVTELAKMMSSKSVRLSEIAYDLKQAKISLEIVLGAMAKDGRLQMNTTDRRFIESLESKLHDPVLVSLICDPPDVVTCNYWIDVFMPLDSMIDAYDRWQLAMADQSGKLVRQATLLNLDHFDLSNQAPIAQSMSIIRSAREKINTEQARMSTGYYQQILDIDGEAIYVKGRS